MGGCEYRGCGKICTKSHGEPETQAARLAEKPCRPLGPNVKIIADGRARYPDAIVVCRAVSPTATIADDPVIVFEVRSEASSETDLIDKNREYRATPSIQRHVVLQQTHKAATVFVRRQDGWLSEIVSGDDARLDLPEIRIAVPLHEVYANARLSEVLQEGTRVRSLARAGIFCQLHGGPKLTLWTAIADAVRGIIRPRSASVAVSTASVGGLRPLQIVPRPFLM